MSGLNSIDEPLSTPVEQERSEVMTAVDACESVRQETRANLGKRLVTSALPYINNVPHLGHMVGSHLPADIFARFSRMKGYDTVFVGGSDENGTPSEIAAKSIDVDIQHFCDVLHAEHAKIYEWFQISYDKYSRTTSPSHHEMTQEFFRLILQNGFVSRETTSMFFDEQEDRFLADRYIEGTCPKCGYEKANGDQCEKCSALLTIDELVEPRSKLSGNTPIKRDTEHLYLDLDQLSPRLEEWINGNTHWKPQVRNLALGWIKEGLKKRSITRDLRHGVKVPMEGFTEKVFYVWFDAPIAYVSATAEARPNDWKEFWENGDAQISHFLGKDNIPFHTIFWPGIIMAEGKKNLPHQVAGMQYLNFEGGKFSKSQKRGVFCESLPESGIDPDMLRAYMTLIIPETTDSEFSWNDFQTRVNSEIIGKYGNFIHRSLTFIQNKLGGQIKAPNAVSEEDAKMFEDVRAKVDAVEQNIDGLKIRQAFAEMLAIAEIANKYFNDAAPWKVVKTDVEKAKEILHNCARLCKILATASAPFIPGTAQKIWQQLGLEGTVDANGSWDGIAKGQMPQDYVITQQPVVLFEKVTDDVLLQYKAKTQEVKPLESYFGKQEGAGGQENF